MTNEESQQLIESAVNTLSEHFDAVQICASWLTPENCTASQFKGSGNWYARKAMCEEFVERDQAVTMTRVFRQAEDEG